MYILLGSYVQSCTVAAFTLHDLDSKVCSVDKSMLCTVHRVNYFSRKVRKSVLIVVSVTFVFLQCCVCFNQIVLI